MADNRSARIVNQIAATQSLDFSRRIKLWSGGLTLTSQSISIPWVNLTGIDRLELYFQQMGSDAGNGYTGGTTLLVSNISTAAKENILPLSGLDFASGKYLACGRYSYQHSGANLVIKWVNKGWFDVPSMTWNDARTMDNGLSLVRIEGYQSFNLVDTYLKSEIDAFLASKLATANKVSYITIASNTSQANGTQYPRANWTPTITYIGDTSNGGFGILCGTIQCNVTETIADGTVADTIYGFSPYQTASLRMNGHGASNSEDIWYGVNGNNTRILNNSGQNRTYTQYASNTFAIPCQKKY